MHRLYTQIGKTAHMKQIFISVTLLFLIFFQKSDAQNLKTRQTDWKQQVDHEIHAELDIQSNILRCNEVIRYQNNSPEIIREIPFHIWPNAFSSNKTAYGKEAYVKGNSKFLQAKKSDRGFLDSLNFEINHVKLETRFENAEIVWVILKEPLNPNQTVEISTPFRVKIPALFSRMGVSDGLYSITQWYPKPAVYDVNGWNTFEYLEQGEYYSEFGNYNVALTLPDNYVVGATGKLQEESELDWLSEVAEESSTGRTGKSNKTIHYVQENVSDFAWFTDPKFRVGEAKVKLGNGHEVHTFSFIHGNLNFTSITVLSAIEKALQYYSKRVGYYAYDYCSAVIGELKAAGGMEYPMITICGDASEGTIIHEVGHNWFQGMLGSQERRYPWMDESINTFYQWYAEGNAPTEWAEHSRIGVKSAILLYHLATDLGIFQAGNLHSEDYQQVNYGTIIYSANPERFTYLQEYLGKSMMDSCMHQYFEEWHFRHPLPGDIQDVFETVSGEKLGWFFNELLGDGQPDVAIQSLKKTSSGYQIKIKNNADFSYPVKLEWKTDTRSNNRWIMAADTTVSISEASYVRLNPSGFLPERNMANNAAKTNGIFKTSGKWKIGFPDLYHRGDNKIWIFPNIFSSNRYDGFTPGLVISNFTFPRRKWEWWLMPSYGVQSKKLVGIAGIQRNIWFQKSRFTLLETRLVGRSFHFRPITNIEKLYAYTHLESITDLYLKRRRPWVQQQFFLNGFLNNVSGSEFNLSSMNRIFLNYIVQLGWSRTSNKKSIPSKLVLKVERGRSYTSFIGVSPYYGSMGFFKFFAEHKIGIPYTFMKSKISGLFIKSFFTGFLQTYGSGNISVDNAYLPVVSGANGGNDYAFQQLLVNRSENMNSGNLWSNQLLATGTGIRMLPNITAQKFAAGVNVESSLIPKVPVNVFFDVALAGNANMDLYWAGGVNYVIRTNGSTSMEVNLPLVYSSNFNSAMQGLKWYEAANFKLSFLILQPINVARIAYQ